jgi:hypothetical protein
MAGWARLLRHQALLHAAHESIKALTEQRTASSVENLFLDSKH